MSDAARPLTRFPLHLGLGAKATRQPEFTGEMAWYMDYGSRVAGDGVDGWLVSMHTFTEPWTSWEMHPHGHEVVICVEGEMVLVQEVDGAQVRVRLGKGDSVINPPGVWHTADIENTATAVFLTAGLGTQGRPRT